MCVTSHLLFSEFAINRLSFIFPLLLLVFSDLRSQPTDNAAHNTFEADNLLDKARRADTDAERESWATESLKIARDLGYNDGVVGASMFLGELCDRTNKTVAALQHFLEAESKLQAGSPLLPTVNRALGDIFFRENLQKHAMHYYGEVLKDEPQDFETMEKFADLSLSLAKFDTAEIYYKQLTVKFRDEGNNPRLVQIYQKLANAYDQRGDSGKSIFYYTAIERIIETYGTPQEKSLLYNNLGRQYVRDRNYAKALEYFRKAELQCVYIPCDYPEVMYANLGVALHNTGETRRGIEYLLRARDILSARQDWAALANLEHLIAGVYFSNNDFYNALNHNESAIKYARQTKQRQALAEAYETAAEIHHQLYDFEKAYAYYRSFLTELDTIRFEDQVRQQRIEQQRGLLAAAESQIKYLIARQNFKDLELQQSLYEQERLKLLNENLALDAQRKRDEVSLLQKDKEVDAANIRQKTLEALRSQQELRLAAQRLDALKQDNLINDLRQQEVIERANHLADSTRNAQELVRIQQEREFQRQQQANFRQFVYGIGLMLFVILALLAIGWLFARRSNRRLNEQNQQIQAQNQEIEAERSKSDTLLRNILPDEIALELKTSGYATPRHYESATVVFTDFVNFTRLSAQLSPDELIDELDECFLAFDEICEKHGLEKIKTIGDAFMCAGGLPVPNDTHPQNAVRAALEMLNWLDRRNREHSRAIFREMRIGVHTGAVVAGVIGKNKFAYDIWGDAVNLAARLEEHSEPGRINISKATAEAVKHLIKVIPRGKKEVYNKGLVEMYFVKPPTKTEK
jgi:class 3 adenylate cyclase/tetratricopeptide (TPR) repeat protein